MRLYTYSLLLTTAVHAVLVPRPYGDYDVAVKHMEVIETGVTDLLSPESNATRHTMISAYMPIDRRFSCRSQVVPYMPPLTASVMGQVGESLGLPAGILEEFDMEFCDPETIPTQHNNHKTAKKFPVLMYSPGFAGSRFIYGALARSLSSLGYVVLTVDHPYEAYVVEFPDGTIAYPSSDEEITIPQFEARIGDVSYVVSQLSNTTFTDILFANFPGTIDPRRVVACGHSFGGSIAAAVTQRDPNIIGGINFDGPINDNDTSKGFDKAFAFVHREDPSLPVLDWDELYDNIKAPKIDTVAKGVHHYAFMDLPLLVSAINLPDEAKESLEVVLGSLDGRRVERLVNEVSSGLIEAAYNNNTRPLKHLGRNRDIEVLRSYLPKLGRGKC